MDEKYDVVIIGGGPSGSTAAFFHNKLGLKTLLIDKAYFPRDKACGDGIPKKVLRLLQEIGITAKELEQIGYRIDCLTLYSPAGVKLTYGEINPESEAKSFCSPRLLFDALIFQKVKSTYPHVYDGMGLEELHYEDSRYFLTLHDRRNEKRHHVSAPLIIGADGANSRVRKLLNLNVVDENYKFYGFRDYVEGKQFDPMVHIFYDELTLPGYFWIFPVSPTRANIGLMIEMEKSKKYHTNIRDMFYQLLTGSPQIKQVLGEVEPTGDTRGCPLPLGHGNIMNITDGAMLIGDAASFINPITGGGIYYGMLSGKQSAEISLKALETGRFDKAALREFYQFYKQKFLPGYNVANRMREYFRVSHNVDHLFRKCKRNKVYSNIFIGLYGRPVSRRFYLNPYFWWSVMPKISFPKKRANRISDVTT
ncbi:MAG: NAD(P)/FAD-dependent oxidoreductase [Calditrichia bacterium]